MVCPNCQYENVQGNFCVKCGAPLNQDPIAASSATNVTGQNEAQIPVAQSPQQKETLQKLEAASKNYWSFFLDVLRNPYVQALEMKQNQIFNALITFGLYLVLYVLFRHMLLNAFPFYRFIDNALLPAVGLAILFFLIVLFVYGGLKFTQIQGNIQEVFTRFGTMLTPFSPVLVAVILLNVLNLSIYGPLYEFLQNFTLYILPQALFLSYKSDHRKGLDSLYVMAIILLLTILSVKLLAELGIAV